MSILEIENNIYPFCRGQFRKYIRKYGISEKDAKDAFEKAHFSNNGSLPITADQFLLSFVKEKLDAAFSQLSALDCVQGTQNVAELLGVVGRRHLRNLCKMAEKPKCLKYCIENKIKIKPGYSIEKMMTKIKKFRETPREEEHETDSEPPEQNESDNLTTETTEKPRVESDNETTEESRVESNPKKITCRDYNKNSILVEGDTKAHKQKLMDLGGRWNATLKAWVFSQKKRAEVEDLVKSLNN